MFFDCVADTHVSQRGSIGACLC